ncbi:hypothetical protein TNCV_4618761 [Trichonephila clavipes]|nr:hypothetical protein TNCV_4618761 [Trichonephila clavipes]
MTTTREPNPVEAWGVEWCINNQPHAIVERADHQHLFSPSVGVREKFTFTADIDVISFSFTVAMDVLSVIVCFHLHAEIVEVEIEVVSPSIVPSGNFTELKIALSPVWCSRPTTGVPLAHATMNFVGLDLTTSDRWHQKTTTTT